ncbi:MAG TPA: response regulator [Bryobacteraceae bacterium]|nr:response regulator [Bryobacteraceae bacterium]
MSAKTHHPARILIIEDNPADVTLLRVALDQQGEEYRIEVLRDGAEALSFVHRQRIEPELQRPCVIVMDMRLPKHDGPAVLEAIRQTPALEHIQVVVLTGVAAPNDEAEVKRLGIRLYRTKPIHLDGWNQLARMILEICHDKNLLTAA